MILAVRTTAGREESVARKIAATAKKMNLAIKAVLAPHEVKGYVFVEADTIGPIEMAIYGMRHVKGIVKKEISIDELKKYLEAKPTKITLKKGDIVELTAGPFKGEKAKIIRIDMEKREATIELLEAAVPIPITIGIESMRLIEEA